jgi:hypothetical protein
MHSTTKGSREQGLGGFEPWRQNAISITKLIAKN